MRTALIVIIILLISFMVFKNKKAEAPVDVENQKVPEEAQSVGELTLSSNAFNDGGFIPAKFTCDGDNVNPSLEIVGVPENTVSLTLIMDDPDVPEEVRPEKIFDHWVLFNIDPATTSISEDVSGLGIEGANGTGKSSYTGPCPPTQYEPTTHRYFFKLYALDTELDLVKGASKKEVESAMEGHILAQAQLMGRYDRSGN